MCGAVEVTQILIPVGLPLIWEPFVGVLEDAEVRKQIWTGKDEDGGGGKPCSGDGKIEVRTSLHRVYLGCREGGYVH